MFFVPSVFLFRGDSDQSNQLSSAMRVMPIGRYPWNQAMNFEPPDANAKWALKSAPGINGNFTFARALEMDATNLKHLSFILRTLLKMFLTKKRWIDVHLEYCLSSYNWNRWLEFKSWPLAFHLVLLSFKSGVNPSFFSDLKVTSEAN